MWNKIAEFVQSPSTKRLAFAIIVSAALHAYFVRGIDIRLPTLKQEMHTIEARLQMPKVVSKQENTIKPVEKVADQPKKNNKKITKKIVPQEPQVDNVAEPLIPETVLPKETDLTTTPEPVAPEQTDDPLPVESLSSVSDDAQQMEPQPVDTGLVINENAYQYVETDFDVRTEIDGATEGNAQITYSLDGQQYYLKSVIKPQGLAALIIGNLLQTSAGIVTKNGLQPTDYLYKYGEKADKTYAAKFDWTNKNVSLITVKGTKTAEIADGTQDLLSFMYQFMYVAPLQRMQISIATGKKLATYDYSFDGEENINIPLGEIKTIHILHVGDENDEKTELWLALDYQYVPVKIRKTEKNGKIYELVATRINTARPVILN